MSNPYMPLYTGDYLRKTRRLKAAEHGAYMLLLMALWDEGGRIVNDEEELREIARTSVRNWPNVWAKLQPYFTVEEGMISSKKVLAVLADTEKKRRSYVERGKRGGANSARNRKRNNAGNQAQLNHSSTNQTNGLVPPKGENQTDKVEKLEERKPAAQDAGSSAPARESGVGLAPVELPKEALDALRMIRTDPAVGMYLALSDVQAFRDAITGWGEGVFQVEPDWLTKHGEKIKQLVTDAGCRLEPQTAKPKLIAITGGKV